MPKQQFKTHEELLIELNKKPGFRKEHRRQKPYYDLAREVFNLRAESGLTQQELADRAGTHQSRISKIESAELDVRLSTLIEIAEALNTVVDIRLVKQYELDDQEYQELFQSQITHSSSEETTPKVFVPVSNWQLVTSV